MYFITGATGFLGRTLLSYLFSMPGRAEPAPTALLVRNEASARACFPAAWLRHLTFIEGSLESAASWRAKAQRLPLAGVFHLAALVEHTRRAQSTRAMQALNVRASCDVVAMARGLGVRCVFVSSSGTVGCSLRAGNEPVEGAAFAWETAGAWPYYRSKMEAEIETRALAPAARDLVIVRPPVMLGPGDERFRSTSTVVRVLKGPLPFSLSGGMACIDVRDLAAPLWAAMLRDDPQLVYHLPGHALPLTAYFALVARLARRPAPKAVLPHPMAMALAQLSVGAAKLFPRRFAKPWLDPVVAQMGRHHWGIASRHAVDELGLRVRPLEQTLVDTIADLRRRRADCRPRGEASASGAG